MEASLQEKGEWKWSAKENEREFTMPRSTVELQEKKKMTFFEQENQSSQILKEWVSWWGEKGFLENFCICVLDFWVLKNDLWLLLFLLFTPTPYYVQPV